MLADGRLNLSAVMLLTPHLTPDTADELLSAAARTDQGALERLLAERFPRPDAPTLVQALAATNPPRGVRTVSNRPGAVARCVNSPRGQLMIPVCNWLHGQFRTMSINTPRGGLISAHG